jgi:hypothetical protein
VFPRPDSKKGRVHVLPRSGFAAQEAVLGVCARNGRETPSPHSASQLCCG